MDRTELARDTANKLSRLLISRRDVKAFERNGEWYASKKSMTLADFEKHLYGELCMGTYLLDRKSRVKFVAFDIDLTGPGNYFMIRELDEIEQMEANGEYDGEMDPDLRVGMWDAALHDEEHDGHKWVRTYLSSAVQGVAKAVDQMLGLPVLPVVTGGGAHVFVPFGHKVPAAEARAAAHGVMDALEGFHRTSDNFYSNSEEPMDEETRRPRGETMTVEVFPKQDELPSPDSFGNLIRLPFGWHRQAGIRTYIMDIRPPSGYVPPWHMPKRSSIEALDEVLRSLGLVESVGD